MKIGLQKFKYREIRDRIIKSILERKLEEGSVLPSEFELCSRLQVSRNTVRNALDLLVKDGTLSKRPGHPCIIRHLRADKPPRKIAWINAGEGTAGFNPVYSDIFCYATEEAVRRNLQLDLIYLISPEMIENFAVKAKDYIGMIFNSTRPDDFNDRILRLFPERLVVVDSIRHSEPCNMVQTDNFAGGCIAAEYLVQQGFRRIGIIGNSQGYLTYQPFHERLQGYRQTLAKYALPEFRFNCEGQNMFIDLSVYLQNHLSELLKCDALFCINDIISSVVVGFFQMNGISVPEDIAIISYDGISLSRFTTPALTCVRQPMEKIAERLIDMILDIDLGEGDFPTVIRLMPELIIRESVKQAASV